MTARARVMKALAHPTRLFMVEELARGERCVCELTEMVGDDISTVSKHLALLRQAGLVLDQRRGQQVFYRLRVPCILNFFGCVEVVLEEVERDAVAGFPCGIGGRRRELREIAACSAGERR